MRKLLLPLIAAAALAAPSAAQAGGWGDDDDTVRPAPLPTQVANETEANAFAKAYVIRNAGTIAGVDLGNNRGRDWGRSRNRRSSVDDVVTACLQHPVVASRFGCLVRFNLNIRDNDRRGDHRRSFKGGGDDDWGRRDRRRDRVRSIGCLAALRIVGGPSVTPSVTVAFADCVERPRARS